MALYKHGKKFFPLPTAIITNTAISRRRFCDIELERFNRKTLQFIHNVVGSVSGCEVISLQKVDSLQSSKIKEKLKRFLQYKAGGIWIKLFESKHRISVL